MVLYFTSINFCETWSVHPFHGHFLYVLPNSYGLPNSYMPLFVIIFFSLWIMTTQTTLSCSTPPFYPAPPTPPFLAYDKLRYDSPLRSKLDKWPFLILERKGCLCFSIKVVEYSPEVCIIELFGIHINHVVQSNSVWDSCGLCSSSSSSSSSRSSSSSGSISSSSSSSCHLALASSGLQCFYNSSRAGQGWSDPGQSARQEGFYWVLVDCLQGRSTYERTY